MSAREASYLTLGRGTMWWLVEADARIVIGSRGAVFAQLSGRGPFARTRDDFAWGSEVRSTLGARAVVRSRLMFVLSSELHWRGGATEPDPFSSGRLSSANAGGLAWTASLAAAVEMSDEISVLAGARVPLASDVTGNQLVPGPGAFAAIAYTRRIDRPRPRIAPTPGTITVVDYWASWCAPCLEISRALADAAARWPDVRIVTIDATRWPDGVELPAGVDGLPAIELYDRAGTRRLLTGPAALRIVEEVDALRAAAVR